MKRLITALALTVVLSGCITVPHVPEKVEPKVVTKIEYVVRVPPVELITPPTAVADIDVDKSTEGDVAKWLADKESYIKSLEDKLRGIALFLVGEQEKLDKVAK